MIKARQHVDMLPKMISSLSFDTQVIPCIIISSLSLFGFYMPADACEKITLTITVLLSMMVFLLLVANILPDSSDDVPLISKYLLFVFFVNTIQVLISVSNLMRS